MYLRDHILEYVVKDLKCPFCNSDKINDCGEVYICNNCNKYAIYTEQEIFDNIDKYISEENLIKAYKDNAKSYYSRVNNQFKGYYK